VSIRSITAIVECDECGKNFPVQLDAANKRPADWSLFEECEDELRADVASVADGKHYCEACTKTRDEGPEEMLP
jgi:hypothetical protein